MHVGYEDGGLCIFSAMIVTLIIPPFCILDPCPWMSGRQSTLKYFKFVFVLHKVKL